MEIYQSSIEVDPNELLGADVEAIKDIFRRASIEALIGVAHKFKLSPKGLADYRERLNRSE